MLDKPEQLGAQGQLCVTPYYNKATQAGLFDHYHAILESCPLPLIVYNVPSRQVSSNRRYGFALK